MRDDKRPPPGNPPKGDSREESLEERFAHRPPPGTREEAIYDRLLKQLYQKKRGWAEGDYRESARLAKAIEERGRHNPIVKALAKGLGLDPRKLPNPLGWS